MGTEDSEGMKYGNRRQRGGEVWEPKTARGEVWEPKTARG